MIDKSLIVTKNIMVVRNDIKLTPDKYLLTVIVSQLLIITITINPTLKENYILYDETREIIFDMVNRYQLNNINLSGKFIMVVVYGFTFIVNFFSLQKETQFY